MLSLCATMNRQLHCMEALFALESRLGRRNTGFVFVTTAPVPDVPAALAAVQRRHPVLRSRLTTDVRSWEPCCSDVAHHISLDERPLPEGDLLDVCARELERNLERALVTQLLHIVVLGGRAFVCVFSHVLFDGASRLIFARDVVRASAGLDLGVEQPVHSNVIDLLRLRDDVPPAEDKPIVPPEAFAPLPPDCADAGADHHVAVDVYEFDVRDALQRCRDHGVTLNSALMTALVYAAVPGRPAAVVGCPINGRKRCGLPDTELVSKRASNCAGACFDTAADQRGHSVRRCCDRIVTLLAGRRAGWRVVAVRADVESHGVGCGAFVSGHAGSQTPRGRAIGGSGDKPRRAHDWYGARGFMVATV